jgi:hypothetical protein
MTRHFLDGDDEVAMYEAHGGLLAEAQEMLFGPPAAKAAAPATGVATTTAQG